MKKIILSFFAAAIFLSSLSSCTENQMARKFGGSTTIELPAGEKLIEATWKDDNLWYLTEPMESGYVPKTKIFREDSSWGMLKGEVKFVEKR